jgi:hypothetical protein
LSALAATDNSHTTACWRFDSRPARNRQSKAVAMGQNAGQKPEALKDKPENGSPAQIAKCHGNRAKHPCTLSNCTTEPK